MASGPGLCWVYRSVPGSSGPTRRALDRAWAAQPWATPSAIGR